MIQLLSTRLPIALTALTLAACGGESDGSYTTAPQRLLAAVEASDGAQLDVYEVLGEGLLMDFTVPEGSLDLPQRLPGYEHLDAVGLFEALAEEPAPEALAQAQLRHDATPRVDGVVMEQDADDEGFATSVSALSAEAFRQQMCFIFPNVNQRRCAISATSNNTNFNFHTNNGERIDFAAQPNSGSLEIGLRQSNFLGTFYTRIGNDIGVPTNVTIRRIFIRNGRRNLRARILNRSTTSGTYHGFAVVTVVP